jgi:glycosyltransferase involved in cell wall biosynthesis
MTSELPLLIQPRISVVICNYNYEAYIAQAINSAMQQGYPAHEVIVVDDGSTDGSLAIISGYAQHPSIRIIRQSNGGQISAYNSGFAAATGDVVLFLDSDDALLPDALGQVAIRFTEGVAKVHFKLALIDSKGQRKGGVIPRKLAHGEVATAYLSKGVPHASPPASGNAYRRSALSHLFPLPSDPKDKHGADFYCVYGSVLFGSVAACDAELGLYRIHDKGQTAAATTFTFGNAAQGLQLDQRLRQRQARMRDWVVARTGGKITPPEVLHDFSNEKAPFAAEALKEARGPWGRRHAWSRARWVLQSIWARADDGLLLRFGLSAWVFVIMMAPHPLAVRAARYVCDPSRR